MAEYRFSSSPARVFAKVLAVVLGTVLVVGCATPASKSAQPTEIVTGDAYSEGEGGVASENNEVSDEAGLHEEAFANAKAAVEEESETVVIKQANVRLESRQYDAALEAIKGIIKDAGGNVTNSNESGGKQRSITLEARVDPEKLEETVEKLRNVKDCTILNANVSSDDITRTYNDTERRIEILNQQYEHYKKMLDSATTTEDMLTISDRMYDVMAEIKSYTDSRDQMDHESKHSLLTVSLEEEVVAGQSGQSTSSNFAEDAWDDSWGMFGEVVRGLVYVLILLLPYLLVAAVVVAIVILVRRRKSKGKGKEDAVKLEQRSEEGAEKPEEKVEGVAKEGPQPSADPRE